VIAAARLRKGSTNSAKRAHRFVADTLITAKACGATGTLVLRADSAFYSSDVIAAARSHLSPPARSIFGSDDPERPPD